MKKMTWALNHALTIQTLVERGHEVKAAKTAKKILEGKTPTTREFKALKKSAYELSRQYENSPERAELEKDFEKLKDKYGIENHEKALGHARQRYFYDVVECFYSRFAEQDYMFIDIESDNGKGSILLTKQQAALLKDILNEIEINV